MPSALLPVNIDKINFKHINFNKKFGGQQHF